MRSRTLFAWIFVAALLFVGLFFTYHIVLAAQDPVSSTNSNKNSSVVPKNLFQEDSVSSNTGTCIQEPIYKAPAAPNPMPVVVGQTEEDLRATRQVSETPPPIEYLEPEAKDPMETVVNSESEFGDNLRHPEQMIEMLPPMGSQRTIVPGVESDTRPSVGGNTGVSYSPEMAQNGGEFMSGIFAFDGTDGGGIGYSMI